MTAYLIGIREQLHDKARYKRYADAAIPTLERISVRVLAAYGTHRVLEGAAAEGIAIIAFDSFEQAESWYQSAEYKKAKEFRDGAADYRMILVEGLS
jgi:uncharacterized protein (DUF1330 family)